VKLKYDQVVINTSIKYLNKGIIMYVDIPKGKCYFINTAGNVKKSARYITGAINQLIKFSTYRPLIKFDRFLYKKELDKLSKELNIEFIE